MLNMRDSERAEYIGRGHHHKAQNVILVVGDGMGISTVTAARILEDQMNGKPGFFVVTPLRVEGSGAVIVVQRGWVQRSFTERAQLPLLATESAVVQIEGRIAPPPSKLYEFAGADPGVIRQNLDLRQYAGEIGAQLLPVSLLQAGGSTDGLQRDWLRVETGVAKHYGYAFQWFALSALITILYVWFQIVRRNPAPR